MSIEKETSFWEDNRDLTKKNGKLGLDVVGMSVSLAVTLEKDIKSILDNPENKAIVQSVKAFLESPPKETAQPNAGV